MPEFLTDLTTFKAAIAGDQLTIVDFTASWCGPCRSIAPVYESLATANPTVKFYKVDVDECADICEDQNIESMPTFLFFKNGSKVSTITGANESKLREHIQQLK